MEGKKISFGFKKVKKAEKPILEEQKDFIECVEEKSIKVVGGEKIEVKEPLVIPLKPNTLITAEKLKEIAAKVESSLEDPIDEKKETNNDIKIEPAETETLDQMAMRELLQEAKKEVKIETQALTVPVPAKLVMDGQKESTLEDYEAVPIQDFGLAMLRGMGWTANQEKAAKYKQPQLRPKGLGLGADKVISDKQKKKTTTTKDGKEEELAIIKNSYVKIIAGKHSGYYGKVVSLDEDNGRVMVDITVKKETVSLSEFMMQPVTKAEFDKESKVINMDVYQEYKKKEQSGIKNSSRNSTQVSNSRHNSPKLKDRNATSSKVNDNNNEDGKEDRKRDDNNSARERKQERNRKNSSSSGERSKKVERYRRYSRSEERVNKTNKESSRRYSSEEDRNRRKERSRRESSSSPEKNRKKKDKSKRDYSEEDDISTRRRKEKSRRDTSEEDDRSSRRKKEKSKRDTSEESRRWKKVEKDKKRYSSNESISSISDSERKKKHKKRKDSSDSGSDTPKKDKRDIDKKRKGKKKKRDRDRSPHHKKHRK